MQKVITIRASQADLNRQLEKFSAMGWKTVSVAKGSEWGRVGFSYKWTIVLEIPDNALDVKVCDDIIREAKLNSSAGSFKKTMLLALGLLLLGIAVIVGIILLSY